MVTSVSRCGSTKGTYFPVSHASPKQTWCAALRATAGQIAQQSAAIATLAVVVVVGAVAVAALVAQAALEVEVVAAVVVLADLAAVVVAGPDRMAAAATSLG